MKAHGAYSQLMTTMRRVRGYADDASRNLKTIWASGPVEEDRLVIQRMRDLTERYRAVEPILEQLGHDTAIFLRAYHARFKKTIKKKIVLKSGSPSLRVRRRLDEKTGVMI